MPEEQPTFYTAAARARIDATVNAYEGEATDTVGSPSGSESPSFNIRLGKLDADVTKGNDVTVSEYRGTTPGSETDTGDNWEVYVRFGDGTSGSWCLFFRFLGHWEMLMIEC